MKLNIDFRLIDVSAELYALEDHLDLIEKQVIQLQRTERLRVDTLIRKEGLSPDDPEWHEALDEYYHRVDLLFPRFFRGPFLIALYAVYESAVTEIARLIQDKESQRISMNDLKGGFLERAKKYYKHVLGFQLCSDSKIWQRITMLSELRNAVAHVNGRLEILNKGVREKIKAWEKQKIGISDHSGYLVFDAKFVAETFALVRASLEDLVARYKRWDDERRSV